MKLVAYYLMDKAHYQYILPTTPKKIRSILDKDFFIRDLTVYSNIYDFKNSSNIVTRVAQYRSDHIVKAVDDTQSLRVDNSSKAKNKKKGAQKEDARS